MLLNQHTQHNLQQPSNQARELLRWLKKRAGRLSKIRPSSNVGLTRLKKGGKWPDVSCWPIRLRKIWEFPLKWTVVTLGGSQESAAAGSDIRSYLEKLITLIYLLFWFKPWMVHFEKIPFLFPNFETYLKILFITSRLCQQIHKLVETHNITNKHRHNKNNNNVQDRLLFPRHHPCRFCQEGRWS